MPSTRCYFVMRSLVQVCMTHIYHSFPVPSYYQMSNWSFEAHRPISLWTPHENIQSEQMTEVRIIQQDLMADGWKYNIPRGGYGIEMSQDRRPSDIPLPYPPSVILHFCPSAMRSCFYTTDCIKILNGHVMTAVVPWQDPLNIACWDPLSIHRNIQWLVFHWKWHICGINWCWLGDIATHSDEKWTSIRNYHRLTGAQLQMKTIARPHGWWTKMQCPTRWIWQRDVTWPTALWQPYPVSTSWDLAFLSCYNLF